jgi:hypothetical protein
MRKLVAPGWNLKVEEMTHDEALNGMGTFGVFMRAMTH